MQADGTLNIDTGSKAKDGEKNDVAGSTSKPQPALAWKQGGCRITPLRAGIETRVISPPGGWA